MECLRLEIGAFSVKWVSHPFNHSKTSALQWYQEYSDTVFLQ